MRSNTLHIRLVAAVLLTLYACLGISEATADPSKEAELIRPVKIITVNDQLQDNTRRFPATVHASEESLISFRVSGELRQLPVRNGQHVKKGDLLAALDQRDFSNQVALRQADYNLARNTYQRIKSLWEQKVASKSELDTATTSYESARVALKLAKDSLDDATLTAPFGGRIGRVDVENYQQVQAQQAVLLLQDDAELEVRIQVPGSMINHMKKDQVDYSYQPQVSFGSAHSRTYPVMYKEHATSVTPGTLSYEVTFTMAEPQDVTIYPGMSATVNIDLSRFVYASDLSGIVVPVTAVLTDDATGKDQVWVYDPESGVVQPVEVTLGRITQKGIHILSGLKNSDQVVAAGVSHLRPGMKVKPLTRERGL